MGILDFWYAAGLVRSVEKTFRRTQGGLASGLVLVWKTTWLWALTATLGATPLALAYDVDTHFWVMYINARGVGIGHEASLQMALGSAHIDVTPVTTAMGGPLLGTHLRKMFHFPSAISGRITYQQAHGAVLRGLIATTRRGDPAGAGLVQRGMKKGSLVVLGAARHTLADTRGHEGYSALLGHANAGHWPDRPWTNWQKFEDMIEGDVRVLLAVRELLPSEALDLDGPVALGLTQLSDLYDVVKITRELSRVLEPVMNRNIFSDPSYTPWAVKFILANAQDAKYIRRSFDFEARLIAANRNLFDGAKTAREIIYDLIQVGAAIDQQEIEVFDEKLGFRELLPGYNIRDWKDVGRLSERQRNRMVYNAMDLLTHGYIPPPLGRDEFGYDVGFVAEAGGPLRELEMALRISRLEDLSDRLFRANFHYSPNGDFRNSSINANGSQLFNSDNLAASGDSPGVQLRKSKNEKQAYRVPLKQSLVDEIRNHIDREVYQDRPTVTMRRADRIRLAGEAIAYSLRGLVRNPGADPNVYTYHELNSIVRLVELGKLSPVFRTKDFEDLRRLFSGSVRSVVGASSDVAETFERVNCSAVARLGIFRK